MDAFEQLLELQALDTEIAQLEHKAGHLPEASALAEARRVTAALGADLARIEAEHGRFAAVIAANEAAVADIRRQLDRLNAQMKTVIAPREAEALQHEMANFMDKISSLEDESLAALERSEELDASLARLGAEIVVATSNVDDVGRALAEALDGVRGALSATTERRTATVASIDAQWVAQYERRRTAHGGVAIARLLRATCGGCHIDLSISEVDAVRREEPTQRECPNCARWLVL
jgi:predicted  nucleic acid-binding Zn-ribbon protein